MLRVEGTAMGTRGLWGLAWIPHTYQLRFYPSSFQLMTLHTK